jgi:hypothetical protein
MRDLDNYSIKYNEQPFEDIQVSFRKKNIIRVLSKYKHNNILEVGCGLDPLFNSFDDFDKLVIVEPATLFYKNAINQINIRKEILIKWN